MVDFSIKEFDRRKALVDKTKEVIIHFVRDLVSCYDYSEVADNCENEFIDHLQDFQEAVSEFYCYRQILEEELQKRGLTVKNCSIDKE